LKSRESHTDPSPRQHPCRHLNCLPAAANSAHTLNFLPRPLRHLLRTLRRSSHLPIHSRHRCRLLIPLRIVHALLHLPRNLHPLRLVLGDHPALLVASRGVILIRFAQPMSQVASLVPGALAKARRLIAPVRTVIKMRQLIGHTHGQQDDQNLRQSWHGFECFPHGVSPKNESVLLNLRDPDHKRLSRDEIGSANSLSSALHHESAVK
jgi:hypothetical protein